MVVFTHLAVRLSINSQSPQISEVQYLFKTFSAGVSAFFVLSGFLLSYPFWIAYFDNARFPSMRLFTLRRAARIVPGFYLSLTFCFLMSLFLIPNAADTIIRYIAGLTFTSSFSWKTLFPAELNGPLWSIGFEVICYFLMPFFMIILFNLKIGHNLKNGIAFWFAVLAVVLFVNQLIVTGCQTDSFKKSWDFGLVGGAKCWWPHYNPVGFFGQYIIGVMSSACTIKLYDKMKNKKASFYFDFFSITIVFLLVCLLWNARHMSPYFLSFQEQPFYYPLFPAGVGLLLCTLPFTRFMGNIIDNRFFKITALLSFGIYIWHNVILEMIKYFWIYDYRHGQMTDFNQWLFISLGALALAYFVAALSWHFIEKPIIGWSHKKAEIIKLKYLNNRGFNKSHIPLPLHIQTNKPSAHT